MTTYRLAVIGGDGVGREVIPVGLEVLRQAGRVTGLRLVAPKTGHRLRRSGSS